MKTKVYRMSFVGPLHVYESGYGMEASDMMIHSDTLFSAITGTAYKLYGDEVIKTFLENGKVLLSSAFPFWKIGADCYEYFLPKPFNWKPEIEKYADQKTFKKVRFVNRDIFERIINGGADSYKFNKKNVVNGCLTYGLGEGNLFVIHETTRIMVDRVTNATSMFNFSEVHFAENAGLYFMASVDESIEKEFRASLNLLADEGIGGDRTVGKGLFEIKEDSNFEFNSGGSKTGHYVLLSLYNPPKEEAGKIIPEDSSYEITTRRGWISFPGHSDKRRKSLRMIKEGSVIQLGGAKPKGRLADVYDTGEGVIIKRYGAAFCAGINTKIKQEAL